MLMLHVARRLNLTVSLTLLATIHSLTTHSHYYLYYYYYYYEQQQQHTHTLLWYIYLLAYNPLLTYVRTYLQQQQQQTYTAIFILIVFIGLYPTSFTCSILIWSISRESVFICKVGKGLGSRFSCSFRGST